MLLELQRLLLPLLVLLTVQETRQLNLSHLCLDVDVVYNTPFKKYLDLRGQDAHEAATIIVQQASQFFKCGSLGQDIAITLRVRNITYDHRDRSAKWRATDYEMTDARKTMTYEEMQNVHHVAYLTHDPDYDGISGKSGNENLNKVTTCNTRSSEKSSIVEVKATSLHTAAVLAHEIAHALTIPDDYTGRCSGSNSIMNKLKRSGSNIWSGCSYAALGSVIGSNPYSLGCIAKDCSEQDKGKGCPTDVELAVSSLASTFYPFSQWKSKG